MPGLRRRDIDHYEYARLLSEYCGLGYSQGQPHHATDALCMHHDQGYQSMLDEGRNPYFGWNEYDQRFLEGLQRIAPHSIRESILHNIAGGVFRFKRQLVQYGLLEDISYDSDEEETKENMSDVVMMEADSERRPGGNSEATGSQERKRSRMEPRGHGNTPATGTELAGFIPKYVPVNFPDKFTVKLRYCDTYVFRSAATSGTAAVPFYLTVRPFSIYNPIGGSMGALGVTTAGHQPNQRDNWAAQWGYYRVTNCEYSFKCQNIQGTTFTETANPPGTFTNPIYVNDAIITLGKSQNYTDMQSTFSYAKWEQKIADNILLTARAPGSAGSFHEFKGHTKPEDFDVDPVTTAGDETWTAVGVAPSQAKYITLSGEPALPYTTASLLPEIGILCFMTLEYTVQFAGYLPGLRQTTS